MSRQTHMITLETCSSRTLCDVLLALSNTSLTRTIHEKHLSPFLKSYWTALSLVLVGIAVVTIMVMSSKGPKHIHSGEKISNVSFIYAEHNNVVPRITGFGVIQPSLNFEALTEVSGRIIFVHQDLKMEPY